MATSNSEAVKRMLRTRGALVAVVAAGGVGLTLLVQLLIGVWTSQLAAYSTQGGLYDLQSVPTWWQLFGYSFFTSILPFAVGFFLSLWIVAPVSERLTLAPVITRSILATGIGATVWFIVTAVVGIISTVAFDRPIFSNSFPQLEGLDGIPHALAWALQGAIMALVTNLPLGVLAGVLLWHWRKANPPKFHVEGLIDV